MPTRIHVKSLLLCCAFLSGPFAWGRPFADSASRPARNEVDILSKALYANDELYAQLQSFVCHEEIQRYKSAADGRPGRILDTISANLSFENGVEHYSEIHQDNHPRPSLTQISGAWSEGEFGTLLLQTEKLLTTERVRSQGLADMDGVPAAIYSFRVSAEDSPWDFQVSGRHYHLPFQTDVWISVATGVILKIARTAVDIPQQVRIAEVEWSVTLQPVDLNGKQWLLPRTSRYSVLYSDSNRREWNDMTFSGYKRYGSEVALRFEQDPK
jgi:hypothetical protein